MFEHFGFFPLLSHPSNAQAVGVGSLLQIFKDYRGWEGAVLGAGLIDDRKLSLPKARFVAVRGAKTKANLGLSGDVQLGDPGLLISRFIDVESPMRRRKIGVIPHYTDLAAGELKRFFANNEGQLVLISPRQSVRKVAEQIKKCEVVLSSSLHGLIFSDALGVANVWFSVAGNLVRSDFKYYDYYTCFDTSPRPSVIEGNSPLDELVALATVPPAGQLEELQTNLYGSLKNYFDEMSA
jgi:pyruvyltransferase